MGTPIRSGTPNVRQKLAEKTKAADLLQKSLKEANNEKAEQAQKLKQLEEELASLKAELGTEEEAA